MRLSMHRGAGATGYNLVEIATDRTKIMLACGRTLPLMDCRTDDEFIDVPGLTSGVSAYDAVFVPSYHADQGNLIARIHADIPVYMNADTKIMLDIAADFADLPLPRVTKYLEHGVSEQVGDIRILPLGVDHGMMGRMLFLVEATGKKLLYTGGCKRIDPAYYAMLGKIDMLLCDAVHIGNKEDADLMEAEGIAADLMRRTEKHVFILGDPTDADRIRYIERACRESGRTMAFDPFMKSILERLSRPLIVDPYGFIPYVDADFVKSPRLQKHIMMNRDMEFHEIKQFATAQSVANMTNLTFMLRPSMGRFLTQLDALTPLAGAVLICFLWRGYEETSPMKEFLALGHTLGMKCTFLRASDHVYRRQLETAVLRLNPAALVPIQTVGAKMLRVFHDHVILLDDGDVFDANNESKSGFTPQS